MFNKILLACCSKAVEQVLLCRLTIFVGERLSSINIMRGYYKDDIGSVTIGEQNGDLDLFGVFSQTNTTTSTTQSGFEAFGNLGMKVSLVNESNGISMSLSYRGEGNSYGSLYVAAGDIFDGIETGQSCVIAIYK